MKNKIENNKTNIFSNEEDFIVEEKTKTILTVDLGTTTGWAISNEFGITSGSANFKQDRFQGGSMRYLNF